MIGSGERQSIFWNLTTPVGPGKPNKLDDVEFCRFGYFMMKGNPKAMPDLTQRERDALARLNPVGGFGPDLAEVILAHQQSRGGTQDGFISVARDVQTNFGQYDHKHKWIVLVLNVNMLDTSDVFPRIDLHGMSGPEITKSVFEICTFKKR
jgi:hypothetical protein